MARGSANHRVEVTRLRLHPPPLARLVAQTPLGVGHLRSGTWVEERYRPAASALDALLRR